MKLIPSIVASLLAKNNDPRKIFRGINSYDRGASYYDPRYDLTFYKYSNGYSWMYMPLQGATLKGVLVNGGYEIDTNGASSSFTDPLKEIYNITIPGGTLIYNNKINLLVPITAVGALSGSFRIVIGYGFNNSSVIDFKRDVASGTSTSINLELTADGVNILKVTSGLGVSTVGGGYIRLINLLSDFTIRIYYTFSGTASGKTIQVQTSPVPYATYTNVEVATPPLPLSNYRDPNITPFSDDSFWNTKLGGGVTYADPATDLITQQIRDQYAGHKLKSGSNTTNYFWISGQSNGDGVPIYDMNEADPVCNFRINQGSTAGIRPNAPWPFLPWKTSGDPSTGLTYYSMKAPQNRIKTGQNSDNFICFRSADRRFVYEMGKYTYSSRVWTSATKIYRYESVIPTDPALQHLRFQANSADGTTGATEPAWPTTPGATVVDNGLTWTCYTNVQERGLHMSNTLYVADIYGLGISNKFYPWYSETLSNSNLSGYSFQQFHRAGGLPAHAGIVTKAQLDQGYIDHVVAMQVGNVMLKAIKFTVVSATLGGNTFVIRPTDSTVDEMNYTSSFPDGTQFGHGGSTTVLGTIYTVSGTPTWDSSTNYTTITVAETITSTSSTLMLGAVLDERRDLQRVWPNVTADSAGPEAYLGICPFGTPFAIPSSVNITAQGLSPEGVILARALQDFGGITVDQTSNTFSICQVDASVTSAQRSNLVADKAKIASLLVRVIGYGKASVQAAQLEPRLSYQKYIVPFYDKSKSTLLLDTITMQLGLSVYRKLRTAYTGACIRVRRSSDNAEMDIGFVLNFIDTASLMAFVGSASAYVVTVYGQSGLGNNATQTIAASQPRIVNAGVLDTENGIPAMFFDGANDFLVLDTAKSLVRNTGYFGLFAVVASKSTGTGTRNIFSALTSGTNSRASFQTSSLTADRFAVIARRQDADSITSFTYSASAGGTAQNQHSVMYNYAAGATAAYTNGVSQGTGTLPSSGNTSDTDSTSIMIGASNVAQFWNGKISEILASNTDQSANRAAIEANQKLYFGTP